VLGGRREFRGLSDHFQGIMADMILRHFLAQEILRDLALLQAFA
jgi:hypothetical protein